MFEAKFQTFEERSERPATPARVAALRAELLKRGLTGFIVPSADRHQSEYVPASEARLPWLTGFTGSAGTAIVLAERAVLIVDGRYTLQAASEIDAGLFTVVPLAETVPSAWLEANLTAADRFGYDPWLHTVDGAEKLGKACAAAGAMLVAVEPNPIDSIWTDRPAEPAGAVALHGLRYSGEAAADKMARVQAEIAKTRDDALIVSDTQSIAWALNIRGADVTHVPVAMAFAIVPREGRSTLYIDGRKLSNDVRSNIEELAAVRNPDEFVRDAAALGQQHMTVRIDQATAADALSRLISSNGGKVTRGSDPITAMKAVKNAVEIAGARAAQQRDGVAMARFLAWFAREAPSGELSEIEAVEALETFRRETGVLRDVSFPTIAGAGPNGAIVHYRVSRATNRRNAPGELFLIDSGGQYLDGTTDITRTLAVGTPSEEMRQRFTLVLKGHIAIARAIFPEGTTGAQLDSFARRDLWVAGLDFEHGTGHGVGSYLSVHEGPARIAKLGATPLKRGMILSNEPGYYKNGAYGIRIENLVLVIEGPHVEGGEKVLNAFETLTFAPIDRNLIVTAMMSDGEIAWLDAYHSKVAATLRWDLDPDTRAWLDAATEPLARN